MNFGYVTENGVNSNKNLFMNIEDIYSIFSLSYGIILNWLSDDRSESKYYKRYEKYVRKGYDT